MKFLKNWPRRGCVGLPTTLMTTAKIGQAFSSYRMFKPRWALNLVTVR